jgi:uncharacterized radical SAM protein YgiQ
MLPVMQFIPVTLEEARLRNWDHFDVILVTGDAYVDHPAFGTAIVARVLEEAGYKVGIIAQPDWRTTLDVTRLGRPRLFFGVTAGNLDSMVANYTSHKRPRTRDDYAPGGTPGLRPDRAVIVYANRIREAFGDVPIVLGGIEASLRRFAHYDWWENRVRRSVLVDARAEIIVYGMGEKAIIEIAGRLHCGADLGGIAGTAVLRRDAPAGTAAITLPSCEQVQSDPLAFNEAFRFIVSNQDPFSGQILLQKQDTRYLVQYPPQAPLQASELDRIYALPYQRRWHPTYDSEGGVPALETVRHSIISHRGCPGACSFCSITAHQGRVIQSRSPASIIRETEILSSQPDFKGTISDVGGPTANLYGARCARWRTKGPCHDRQCLGPDRCRNLELDHAGALALLRKVGAVRGVKHVFLESGLRHDLLVDESSLPYLTEICRSHVSGRLKVAPEHSSERVLKLMNKPPIAIYEEFLGRFRDANRGLGRKQFLVNYFISAHPGATLDDALHLSLYLQRHGMHPEQIQDFIPLPLTASSCMYHTGMDPWSGTTVHVARTFRERKMHRALLQYWKPANRPWIAEALRLLKKEHLMTTFLANIKEERHGGGPKGHREDTPDSWT